MLILGNDVSLYQGDIDFRKMKQAGCQFVYILLGWGWNKANRVDEYRRLAKEAGILYNI